MNLQISASQQTTYAQYDARGRQYQSVQTSQEFKLSIESQEQPLKLAYQAVVDRINEEVESVLGENAIQRGYGEGIDVSPEATAKRIVSMSTGLFSRFEAQHPDLEGEALTDHFISVIKSGVEQGFAEAKDILSGLGVLEGEIEINIDLTFDLVIEGLDDFALSRSV